MDVDEALLMTIRTLLDPETWLRLSISLGDSLLSRPEVKHLVLTVPKALSTLQLQGMKLFRA